MVESFNEAFQSNRLSDSWNVSVLSLIFKKGDPSNIKNYRPISLTNTDYKLLAHVLTNRLHNVLYKIISTDQTGYIKNRYIGTNIRKIINAVDYLESTKKTGILLMLDFEKAFDTVEWSFLFQTIFLGHDKKVWIIKLVVEAWENWKSAEFVENEKANTDRQNNSD